jgi:putative ABC transport system ATP-binding protein
LIFRLEDVTKTYERPDGAVEALRSASLEIALGEFVAIVGPSGSGKSTLLTILGGMLSPTAGKVWLEGRSLYDLSVAERAEARRLKMGFVFQTFNLVPYLTALENVQVPLLLARQSRQEQLVRAMQLLDQVGLADRAHHKPSELSTGQQQRVALARTLANDPAIVFADEPTGNLDPQTRNNVLEFLDKLHAEGKTIVLVTHDQQVAYRADRTVQMVAGRIEEATAGRLKVSA